MGGVQCVRGGGTSGTESGRVCACMRWGVHEACKAHWTGEVTRTLPDLASRRDQAGPREGQRLRAGVVVEQESCSLLRGKVVLLTATNKCTHVFRHIYTFAFKQIHIAYDI